MLKQNISWKECTVHLVELYTTHYICGPGARWMISNNMLHTSPSQERASTKRTQNFVRRPRSLTVVRPQILMTVWEGAGAVKQKEKYKAHENYQANCQVTNFRFVWWYEYRRGCVNIGEMWGSNREIRWIYLWVRSRILKDFLYSQGEWMSTGKQCALYSPAWSKCFYKVQDIKIICFPVLSWAWVLHHCVT